jgi:hypothetical protein
MAGSTMQTKWLTVTMFGLFGNGCIGNLTDRTEGRFSTYEMSGTLQESLHCK